MSNAHESVPLGTTMPAEHSGSGEFSANVEMVSRDRYALGEEIAQGGIGRVFQASDRRLERHVALKQLLDPSPEHEARFLREALVTARLQHPAIVPVYDVGRFADGEIFYAMKLVTGRSLGDIVHESDSFDKRLALLPHVITVAEAIAYAHSERIVHRDLKPANILIGPFGETVVIDWGIAKDLREQEELQAKRPSAEEMGTLGDGSASLTMAGAVLGTPGYMPPEQAEGSSVDERADVYALGAILYYVLAGIAPYEGKSGFEILSRVLTEEPPDLSTRERRVPRDLLAIVRKAMARDAQGRYPTANEFAHDLRRFQTGQIVGAYHYSRRERAYRFAQKHRGILATTALGLLVVGVIGFTSLARVLDARQVAEVERDRANEERARAETKQTEAESASRKALQQTDELLLLEARTAARRDPNAAIAWLSSLSNSFHRWGEARLIAADAQEYGISKVLRGHTSALNMIAYSPDGSRIATASDDRRAAIWTRDGKLERMLEGHTDEVWRIVFSDDGQKLLTSSKDGSTRLWDVNTGHVLTIVEARGAETAWSSFLDEHHIATIRCTTKHVEIHDLRTKSVEELPGETGCPGAFGLSPDRRTITYAADGSPRVYNLDTREYRDYKSDKGRCIMVYVTPNGRYISCAGTGEYSSLWDTKSGQQMEVTPASGIPVFGMAQFSPDGNEYLFSKGTSFWVKQLNTGKTRLFEHHQGPIFAGLFSRDGQYVATTSFDRTVAILDLANTNRRVHFGFRDTTSWADFSPDKKTVAVASWDGTARIFPVTASRNRIIAKGSSPMKGARFSADGKTIVSLEKNGTLHIDSLNNETPTHTTTLLEGENHILSFDGSHAAYASKKGVLQIHKVGSSGEDERFEGHSGALERIHLSKQNTHALTVGTDKTVRLWDLASHECRTLIAGAVGITSANFSNGGKYVAVGNREGIVRVFPIAGGPEQRLTGHVNDVHVLNFLPGDKQLVSGGQDHTLRIWDLESGRARTIDASGLGITQILSSEDGKTLYSLGMESAIRRWDVATGNALPILRGHRTVAVCMALSPEESRLVSTGSNGDVRLWDLATGESRILEGHRDSAPFVLFSPKGDQFISAGNDASVRIWHDDLPFDGPALRGWMNKVSAETGETTAIVN